jgi:ribosome-associated protein
MLKRSPPAGSSDDGAVIRLGPSVAIPQTELRFEFSRSGGPGGQHVNKVSTRVDLLFDLDSSQSLDDAQKVLIRRALATRLDSSGTIRLSAHKSRSQWQNRQEVVGKFQRLLREALIENKRRVASKPTLGSRERRATAKKRRAEIKRHRGRVSPD